MRINGVLTSSLVNGDGIRYVIFLQGCPHHCDGCQNPDTWDPKGGYEISVEDLVADIKKRHLIDGITLSGGEPFMQQEECCKLIGLLPDNLDIWVYTGFRYEEVAHMPLAKVADYIVDGRFEMDNLAVGKMYGSNNQRIINVKEWCTDGSKNEHD